MSNIEAQKLIGIDIKNENNIALFLLKPDNKPPLIVVADLETPGIRENICKKPIFKESLYVILYKFISLFVLFSFFSATNIKTDPTIKKIEIGK